MAICWHLNVNQKYLFLPNVSFRLFIIVDFVIVCCNCWHSHLILLLWPFIILAFTLPSVVFVSPSICCYASLLFLFYHFSRLFCCFCWFWQFSLLYFAVVCCHLEIGVWDCNSAHVFWGANVCKDAISDVTRSLTTFFPLSPWESSQSAAFTPYPCLHLYYCPIMPRTSWLSVAVSL